MVLSERSMGSSTRPNIPSKRAGIVYLYTGPLFINSKSYFLNLPVWTKSVKLSEFSFVEYAQKETLSESVASTAALQRENT